MRQFARIRPSKGVAADLPAASLSDAYWSGVRNVLFRPHADRASGYAACYPALDRRVRSMLNANIGGSNYWLVQSNGGTQVALLGGVETDITYVGLANLSTLNQDTVGLFNGLPIYNNGVDPPMYWDGNIAHKWVALPAWFAGTACYSLRAHKNYLMALNIQSGANFPDQVRWSSSAAAGSMPAAWTPAAANDAGDATLSDSPGALIDGATMGSSFVAYKFGAAYALDWTQTNFIFVPRRLPIGHGVLSRNCIADVKGRHFVLCDGDMRLTDGASSESVANNRMRKFVFTQINPTEYRSAFVVGYKRKNEIWVCFPSGSSTMCDLAAVWNYEDDEWGVRELQNFSCGATGIVSDTVPAENWDADSGTWESDSTRWNESATLAAEESLVFGQPDDVTAANSKMHRMDVGLTNNGADFEARVSKYSMDLGDPERVKLARRLYIHSVADVGTQLLVRVGSQMEAGGPIAWSAERTVTLGSGAYVDVYAVGRFFSLEARSTAAKAWTILGIDIDYKLQGLH